MTEIDDDYTFDARLREEHERLACLDGAGSAACFAVA